MTRRLSRAVVADGVLYPAGTAAEAVKDSDAIPEGFWTDDDAGESEEAEPHPNAALIREVVEYLAERHLADVETPVSELLAGAVEMFGEPEGAGDDGAGSAPTGVRIAGDYGNHKNADLSAEIDARNADRDPEGETYIKPDGKNKDDLVAALEADDQRS